MNISKQEAEASLAEVERVIAQTRRAIAAGHSSSQLILWGVIWVIGYGASQFFPQQAGLIWLPLSLGGMIYSLYCCRREGSPLKSPLLQRMGWFFISLFAYAFIWAFILHPFNVSRFGAYMATVAMFSYIVGGIWFDRFFLWLGLGVTALTLIGVTVLPAWMNLWMAVTCGGSLIAAGVYIRSHWR